MKNFLFAFVFAVSLTGGGIVFAQSVPMGTGASVTSNSVVTNTVYDTETTTESDADAAVLDPSITKRNSGAVSRYMNDENSTEDVSTEDTTTEVTGQ